MPESDEGILDAVRRSLGAERLAGAIVYLDSSPTRAGDRVAVGDVLVDVPWDGHLVFVDLEPKANWGHPCCYLAIRQDAGAIVTVPARMPPFLKAGGRPFRLLWRGPGAPEWAVAAGSA